MDWADEIENPDLQEVVVPKVDTPPPAEEEEEAQQPPPPGYQDTFSRDQRSFQDVRRNSNDRGFHGGQGGHGGYGNRGGHGAQAGPGSGPPGSGGGAASDRWKNYKAPVSKAPPQRGWNTGNTAPPPPQQPVERAEVADSWRRAPAAPKPQAPPQNASGAPGGFHRGQFNQSNQGSAGGGFHQPSRKNEEAAAGDDLANARKAAPPAQLQKQVSTSSTTTTSQSKPPALASGNEEAKSAPKAANQQPPPPPPPQQQQERNETSASSQWTKRASASKPDGLETSGAQAPQSKSTHRLAASPASKSFSMGIIASLKEEFGFIQLLSESASSDVFFHFDEVRKTGSCDPLQLKLGNEVEFELVVGKGKRLSASKLKLLEPGSVTFDETVEGKQGLVGVIITEGPRPQQRRGGDGGGPFNQHGHGHGRGFGHQAASLPSHISEFLEAKNNNRYWTGRIKLLTEEQVNELNELVPGDIKVAVADGIEVFPFTTRGIKQPKKSIPKASDEHKNQVSSNSSGKEPAEKVEGVDDDNASVATSRSTTSRRSHSRQHDTKRSHIPHLQRGDIVRFDVAKETATGRIHAVNIELRTSGSSRVQKMLEARANDPEATRERGRVASLATPSKGWNPSAVGVIECEDRMEKVHFYYRNLPKHLHPGNAIKKEKAQNQKSDKDKDNAKKEEEDKEGANAGTDSSDKEAAKPAPKIQHQHHGKNGKSAGGFASSDWRLSRDDAPTSKPSSSKATKPVGPHVGMELEFIVVKDVLSPNRLVALNIEEIPRGSIKLEEEVIMGARAKVIEIPRFSRKSHQGDPSLRAAGKLQLLDTPKGPEGDSSTKEEPSIIEYQVEELVTPAPLPQPDDIVVADVFRIKRTGKMVVRCIQLVEPSEEAGRISATAEKVWEGKCRRETGVVNNVLDAFGFIDCFDRPGQMFFPLKEVIAVRHVQSESGRPRRAVREELLKAGDLVSFQVDFDQIHGNNRGQTSSQQDRRTVAMRVMKTSHVDRELILAENVSGTVSRSAGRPKPEMRNSNSKKFPSRGRDSDDRFVTAQVKDNGTISCEPTALLDRSLFDKLVALSRNELEVEQDSEKVLASGIELVVNSKITGNRNSSKDESPKDADGVLLKLSVPANTEALAREYCAWLGLHFTSAKSGQASSFVKRRPSQRLKPRRKSKDAGDKEESAQTEDTEKKLAQPEKPVQMSVAFSVASLIDKELPGAGSTVEFRLCLDKATYKYVARDVKVIKNVSNEEAAKTKAKAKAKAKEVITGPVTRRPDSEVGIVALLHDQNYGFLQSADRPDRLFFRQSDCENECWNSLEPGDEVEYFCAEAKQGIKATALRVLPPGTVVADDLVLDPLDTEKSTIRGTIFREPKALSEIRNVKWKQDHPSSMRLSLPQLPPHLLGKVVEKNGSDVELPPQNAAAVDNKPDWRRGKELARLVERFDKEPEEGENIWEVDPTLPHVELKDIERLARRAKLFTGWVNKKLVIARTRADHEEFRKSKKTPGHHNEEEDQDGEEDNQSGEGSGTDTAAAASEKPKVISYTFSLADIQQPVAPKEGEEKAAEQGWLPAVGDEVEFVLCRNRANKRVRATNIKLISSNQKLYRGIIEGQVSDKYGFVRPLQAGRGLSGEGTDAVDESFRPGLGGRDGSIRFDRNEVRDNVHLADGDEVEYTLSFNNRSKEARASRLRLIKRAPVSERPMSSAPPRLNRNAIKLLGSAASAVAVQRFSTAKGPDGTTGFPAGRGRNIPLRTKLRVTAKEFTPGQ